MSDQKICPTCGTEYPLSERFCPRDGTALRASGGGSGDLLGTVIADRYHILKKLGEGGMGQVYLAEHVKMGRKAALKVMNPGMNQDPDAIARFNREAANASRLNHPNVCAIYDFGETSDGLIYLAMEFIEGQSLTALIEKTGSLPAPRAAAIIHQAADALGVAHDYGIVHRDLKPDNIMISKGRDGGDVVKVVDFGIAKASSSDAQKVTKTGLVVGTPEYMSPEQLAGDTLDGRSDIYSLGLVAFNCLTGTLPFPSKSAQEAMIMRLTDQPKKLADMKADVQWPAELQTVLDRALARDANDRYQNAPEFGRDIAKAVEKMPATVVADLGTMVISAGGGGSAMPQTRVANASDAAPAGGGAVASAEKKGMSPALIGGGVVGVLAIGFAVMKFAGGGGKAPETNPPSAKADSLTLVAQPGGAAPAGATAMTAPPAQTNAPANTPASAPSGSANAAGTKASGPTGGKAPDKNAKGGTAPAATPPSAPANAGPLTFAQIDALYEKAYADGATAADARGVLAQLGAGALEKLSGRDLGMAYAAQAAAYTVLEQAVPACNAAKRAQSSGAPGKVKNFLETIISSACP